MSVFKSIYTILLWLPVIAFAQDIKLNWSILIDEKIETLSSTQLIIEYDDLKRDTIPIKIIPGDILIPSEDYDFIVESGNIKQLTLTFEYPETCKDIIIYHHYDIPINKNWLDKPYFILYIYNTERKENKGIYIPLPNKTYNYDYRFPNSGSRIIQKKLKKEQRKCRKMKSH